MLETMTLQGFRLSPQQRRAWQMVQDSAVPASQSLVRLEGELDEGALAAALDEVVRRQEILRTCFQKVPGLRFPVQVVRDPAPVTLGRVDLTDRSAAEREAEVERLVGLDRRQPCDLAEGRPLRARLFRLGERDHRLLLTLSPVCADSTTLRNLAREVARGYAALLGAGEPTPDSMQYADFAEWQNDWLSGDEAEEGKDHWRRQGLSGRAGIALPDAATPVFDCESLGFLLEPGEMWACEDLAARQDAPLAAVFLAAWQSLLARLAGHSEVMVGAVCDGRSYAEIADALGPFARTLPLSCVVDGRSFQDLVRRTGAALREAEAWQEYFVADEILPADADGRPRFQPYAFELDDAPGAFMAGGLRLVVDRQLHCAERFELRLTCSRRGEALAAELQYDPQLVSREQASRLAGRLRRLLTELLAHPERAATDVDILEEEERRLLLEEWNRTAEPFPAGLGIHQLIEAQAAARPDAPALLFEDRVVTYAELEARADRLARVLVDHGVRPGALVAVCSDRTPETVAALLAVLKAGAAYVALDPEQPMARLRRLLEETRSSALLVPRDLAASVPEHPVRLFLDGELPPSAAPLPAPDPDRLAYVAFSSGSTGRPKGVLAGHRGVVNYLCFLRKAYGLDSADVVLQIPELTFDSSVRDLLGPLAAGGRVVLVERGSAKDPSALLRKVRESRVTCLLSVVPTMLRALLDAAAGEAGPLDSVRLVLASGEVLRADDGAGVERVFGPGARLFNQYGPTECTMTAGFHPVLRELGAGDRAPLPLGRPIPNTRFYLLDQHLLPVPVGIPGELYIGGDGLAFGYLDAPGPTAERFVPDPFASGPGSRLYRTGDLAVHRPDGVLEFRGRVDHQVKLRGVRVEPGEIEAELLSHPAVQRAVVMAREDSPGDTRLVAYVVLRRRLAVELSEEERYVLPNQMLIAQQNRYETDFFYEQIFVDQVELRHGVTLADGDVVFDVGANIGLFSLFVHQVCRRPRLFSFEPIPEIFATLRTNMELYGLSPRLFNCGLSDHEGSIRFSYYPHSSCQSGYYADAAQETRMLHGIIARQKASSGGSEESRYVEELVAERMETRAVVCPVQTVSQVMRSNGLDRIDLLKIDTEKAELDVLRGVRDEDWPRIRQVVIEGHDLEGRLAQLVSLLESHGFEVIVEKDEMLEETCLFNIYAFRDRPPGASSHRQRPLVDRLPLASSELLSSEELRLFLRSRLPEVMIPAAFVILDTLPTTPNGKVDRGALPAPAAVEAGRGDDRETVLTTTEEILAAIWCEVLGREQVGIRDDFFELGGHSLIATQVVLRAREAFKIELPLRSLFELPSIERLAAFVDRARGAGISAVPPLVARDRQGPLPLSFAQERLWFLDQLHPGSSFYNIPGAVRLVGPLRVAALRLALDGVAARHEALRTRFRETGGQPLQVIDPPAAVPLPVVDLSALPAEVRERACGAEILSLARLPFDLARDRLLRVALLSLGEEDHVVAFSIHHIVSDGWSNGLFFREVGALYREKVAGIPADLPELPVQYADYAAWQRSWLQGEVLEAEIDHWRGVLAGVPPFLDLPTDRQRPATPTQAGARVGAHLPEDLARRIVAMGRAGNATSFMTLLAGFAALLFRYSGQGRFAVGTPVAGRNRLETERLIGFFNNNLVLPCELSGTLTFRELLDRVRETCIQAFDHQDLPFEKLVEALNPERSLSHSPLFQAAFVLQSQKNQRIWGALPQLPDLDASTLELERGTAKFDLLLSVQEWPGGLSCNLEFATELFEVATAERLLAGWRRILTAAAVDPGVPVPDLPLLSEAELQQILGPWSGPRREVPVTSTLHELFSGWAAVRPEAVAVVHEEGGLSYRELELRSDRLAGFLQRIGVSAEDPVGLCLERSPDLVVAILGVLKAGGAYVPLDPSLPQERLAYVLEDSGARVVLTRTSLLRRVGASGVRTVCLDDAWEEIGSAERKGGAAAVDPGQLAYIIYTSGSTGRPKGTLMTHGNVARLLRATEEWFDFGPEDVWTLFHSPAFDFSVWEIWGALAYGGRLVVVPQEVSRSPEAFHDLLASQRVTVLNQTPTAFRQLDRVDAARGGPELALRWIIFGGEALELEALRGWLGRHGDERPRLVNMYGITETTVHVTGRVLDRSDLAASWRSPLGWPIADLALHVLDGWGRPAAVGSAGEIHVGGAGLSRGYLGRPDLTAERFVPDPFSGVSGARLYRSGDLARRLPSGEPVYLGRIDHQVKIRGFRIEPGEIEAALLGHPGVREAVVMARQDLATGPGLVAYVLPADEWAGGEAGLVSVLRASLRERLPDYMVPGRFTILSSLPLTPNGKVDRRALQALERSSPEQRGEAEAGGAQGPRDQAQDLIAAIWCEVLALPEVGVEEDFFDLGGHSLLATQVVSRIRESLGADLSVSALFHAPTVAGLAAEVETALRGDVRPAPPIGPADRDTPLPLSFAQERLWLLDLLRPGDPLYNVPLEVRIGGDLDVAALAAALSEVIRRHEVLRTRFERVEGQPVQVIDPAAPVSLEIQDLSALPVGERRERVRELAQAAAREGFDLAWGPLLRLRLVRLEPREHTLVLVLHHVVTDGWSMGVLVRELTALYQAFRERRPSPLAELPLQYADYAAWQRSWLQGEVLEAQVAFWERQLGDSPALLELPTDRPRPAVQTHAGASVDLGIPPRIGEALRVLSRRSGATMFMTTLAAFAALLQRMSGEERVNIGTAVAGRNRVEVEDLIGFFVNTLVLRLRAGQGAGFGELLARARRVTLEAQSHQDAPFELLVERLRPRRNLSHSPLFQHFFAYEEPGADRPAGDLSLLATSIDTGTAKFDLSLSVAPTRQGGLRVTARYNTALFDATTVLRLLRRFEALATAVSADPGLPLSSLAWLGPEERQQVLVEWNDRPSPAGYATVVEAFEAQVDRAPEAPALVEGETVVTYGELDRWANRLAHHLRGLGAGPELVVALCFERSLDAVVAMLAVLKAGAAYLPVDPALPQGRKAALLEDSGAGILMTRGGLAEGGPRPPVTVDLDAEGAALSTGSAERPAVRPAPGDLAYVIYTSGSTGRPKGVLVEHRGIPFLCAAERREFGVGPGDRVLQFASLGFDASVWEIWGALTSGAALVLASRQERLPGSGLMALLRRQAVTCVTLPPSALAALPPASPAELPALRALVVAGEPCPAELAWRWREGGRRVINAYGPTELTVCATMADTAGEDVRLPIGAPIPGTRVYVLDRSFEPVPPGVPGECWVGSPGIARGYLGQPEQTARHFVPDPFGGRPGERLYRTGDLVRYRSDGQLEFLGRIDEQVKLHGFRIEPAEVESALLACPGVAQAVVRVAESSRGDQFLTAYVVPADGERPTAEELRALLRRGLPDYMVPSLFGWLPELPRTTAGKVDLRALPRVDELTGAVQADLPPGNAMEELVARVWCGVLPAPSFGIDANFFDLGGHSLLLARVQADLEAQLGKTVPMTALFRFPTVRSLAAFLAAGEETGEDLTVQDERGRMRRSAATRSGARRRRALVASGEEAP